MRLSVESPQTRGESTILSAVLEGSGAPQRLWWQVPTPYAGFLDTSADPFVVAFMIPLMQQGGTVHIRGRVSPSLLSRLERYAAVWRSWEPTRYKPVFFLGEQETEAPTPESESVIIPFSCGVDSSYAFWRHFSGSAGRRTRRPGAALLLHGFDVRLDQAHSERIFAGVEKSARAMLAGIDVPLLSVRTNFHELSTRWAHSFGTQLFGGLRLFAKQFAGAIIPNSIPYNRLDTPWGSHPLIDPELSSKHFTIEDEGGEVTRFEKLASLQAWPEALAHLRVCFGVGSDTSENCGVCEKCVRTILAFRIAGVPLPKAFKRDVSDDALHRLTVRSLIPLTLWEELHHGVINRGHAQTSWGKALRKVCERSRRRQTIQKFTSPFVPLRNAVRYLFRGSTLSKKEMALRHSTANKPR